MYSIMLIFAEIKKQMRSLLAVIILVFFCSCRENVPKKDVVTNTYYSKYKEIYNSYDSLGVEKTIIALDKYIQEFPNAQNAYIFKAWILANDGKIEEIDTLFKEALKYDPTNVEIYEYWAALLMKDSTKINKAEYINNLGFELDKNNTELLNNKSWILLFNTSYNEAFKNSLNVLALDTNMRLKYYRTAAISSKFTNKDSLFTYYYDIAKMDSLNDNRLLLELKPEDNLFEYYKQLK